MWGLFQVLAMGWLEDEKIEAAKLNKYFEIFLEEEGNSFEVDKKLGM